MKQQLDMNDFVNGNCKAAKNSEKFLTDWFKTRRNPCSVCLADKSKCALYQELLETGALSLPD